MSKLSSVSSNPTIKAYAQGAAQRNIQPVADFLAPGVEVTGVTGKFKIYTAKSRFKIPKTLYTPGSRATQLGYSTSDATYDCAPNALDYPVSNLEQMAAADLEDTFKEAADELSAIAGLSHEKKVVDLALDAVGAGSTLAVTANDDLIAQMDAKILGVIKAAKYGSLMGVGVLMGATYWMTVKNHVSVRNRYVSGGKNQFAVPDLNDFGNLLISKPTSMLSMMVYDDADEGLDEDIKFVLDKSCIIFARMDVPNRRDPSFMKTFRLRDQWMKPGAYKTEDERSDVAKMDWSEDARVTNASAADRLNVL